MGGGRRRALRYNGMGGGGEGSGGGECAGGRFYDVQRVEKNKKFKREVMPIGERSTRYICPMFLFASARRSLNGDRDKMTSTPLSSTLRVASPEMNIRRKPYLAFFLSRRAGRALARHER